MKKFKSGKYLILDYEQDSCEPAIEEFTTFRDLCDNIGIDIDILKQEGFNTQQAILEHINKDLDYCSNRIEVYYIKPNNDLIPFLV